MTRQEAKKYLIEHCNPDYPSCGRLEWDRAMDVAIRALEQDDVIDRVLEIIDSWKEFHMGAHKNVLNMISNEVKALKGEQG